VILGPVQPTLDHFRSGLDLTKTLFGLMHLQAEEGIICSHSFSTKNGIGHFLFFRLGFPGIDSGFLRIVTGIIMGVFLGN